MDLDHIVFATADLQAGQAWLTGRLHAPPVGGGAHPLMGTHNALWSLGPTYLELIAIDPAAPPPSRPRFFDLGTGAMQDRIRDRPALIHWVMRSRNTDTDLPALGYDPGPALPMTRGDLHWRLTVRADGTMAGGGLLPSLVEWPSGVTPPPGTLPDAGLRLSQLLVTGAAATLAHAPAAPGVHTVRGTPGLAAEIIRGDGSTVRFASQI